MTQKLKDLPKREMIGADIEVIDSKNRDNIGISGRIIDETKHSFVLETKEKKRKRLLKSNITFIFSSDGKKILAKGSVFSGAPELRIKSKK